MDDRSRLLDRFATVQLTLLSIVVALILENLLSNLFALDDWTPLVLVQAADILLASLAMWVGFAYGLSFGTTRPTPIDFMGLFGLLIFMQFAVRFIYTGSVAGFLVSGGAATLTAGLMIMKDVRAARSVGMQGPERTMWWLLGVGSAEVLGAALFKFGIINTGIALALIATTACCQGADAWRSMRFWHLSTQDKQPSPSDG